MAKRSVSVGDISNASGEVNIAGGDIHKGFTSEQVTALLTQITITFQPKPFDGRCPYKGLDVFEEEDAELFFGREKSVEDLVARVKESRTIFITGPSGSGKSSLVRAGLIPALKRGSIKTSERWLYETVKPGRDPLEALALAFSRLKSPELGKYFRENVQQSKVLHECAESALSGQKDQRLVLFFDQFEEVFTQLSHEETRAAFLDLLTHAASVENGRVTILFAMRSDFISNCATYPKLNSLLNEQFVQIGAMQPDELVNAIAQPALRVGLRIDPDLVAQIINDMHGEPGTLPLMQFALKDLFEAEQAIGGIIALTREAYLQRGGIQKSLERHADASFGKLDKREQELARSIFSGLIEIGRGTHDTRRTALLDELIPANASVEELETIVGKLADARLITTDEQAGTEMVTISHEKLIEAWPWLNQLVNNNREFIQLQNQIVEDAFEWEQHGKDRSYLYTGTRLTSVQKKIHDFQVNNEKAKIFLLASRDANRRSRLQRLSIVSLLLIMGIAIYYAAIIPLIESEINLQPVDTGGAGVNALQVLPDGTVYAGMFNYQIKGGAPCLALLAPGAGNWEKFGPTCTNTVVALWVNPLEPKEIFFTQANETGLYRTLNGGQSWERVATQVNLPMMNISSLVGTENGTLYAGDLQAAIGVYKSIDQGETWIPLEGAPSQTIFTLLWVPQKGLLVGGNGGLWLWKTTGDWEHLINLDVSEKDRRILSVAVISADIFTVLAGGDEGIYLWKDGDPPHSIPRNDIVKKVWSLAVVTKPEPFLIAMTFPDTRIWRMTLDGEGPKEMKAIGSDGFPLIVQQEDPLRLWVGTVEGLFAGELRNKASLFIEGNK